MKGFSVCRLIGIKSVALCRLTYFGNLFPLLFCFEEGMVIGITLCFFSVDLDDLCSQINSINILIYGKMAEDCAKVIHHGVKYMFLFYFRNCFPQMYVDFLSCLCIAITKIRNIQSVQIYKYELEKNEKYLLM